jgi:DNA-binding MarR family transcriptional regulator
LSISSPRPLPETSARRRPENLAILLREPLRDMTDELIRRLAERGHPEVRFAHGNVFQYLDDAGTRIGVLAERAGTSKQAMAQLVAHLEAHGYVTLAADPADRRAKLVRATDRGRAVFVVARELMQEIDARLDAKLGPAKMRRLRALLAELGGAVG